MAALIVVVGALIVWVFVLSAKTDQLDRRIYVLELHRRLHALETDPVSKVLAMSDAEAIAEMKQKGNRA